ncbi:hypothetical protein EJB05_08400, partial [Eragrostis curvula]
MDDDLEGDSSRKEERVRSLLAAADRCGLERMKLMCASILCKGLKVENVTATLALAEQHHRVEDVVASPGYELLKAACPSLPCGTLREIGKVSQPSVCSVQFVLMFPLCISKDET